MPFTISHVAAVLPFHRSLRRQGYFSAAIIGSMVPDLGFLLLPLRLLRSDTHSAVSLFTFSLPLGLASYWLFQLMIKPAWCAVLPSGWRTRLRDEHPVARIGNWRVWLGAAVAVLLGALTHLVWDAFTHEDGRGVRMLPFLDDYGPAIEGNPLRLYRWLQFASSVVGLAVVMVAAWKWRRGDRSVHSTAVSGQVTGSFPELGARERHTWLAAYLLIPMTLLILGVVRDSWNSIGRLVWRLGVRGLVGAIASLVLVSALVRLRLALSARRLDDQTSLK